MAAVTVGIFASLRRVVGTSQLDLQGVDSVRTALTSDERLGDAVLPGGSLAEGHIVLVNGRNIHHLQGLDTALADGDRVAVFPAVGGG
jgi:molybdopterin synthase sulfur carrier subunit